MCLISLAVILDNLAQELTLEEIVREYPPLTEENVRVAATLAKEEELLPLRSRSATP